MSTNRAHGVLARLGMEPPRHTRSIISGVVLEEGTSDECSR